MPHLLDAAYLLAILLAWPWLLWQAATRGKYREGFAAKLLGRVPPRDGRRPCVWLHAVSVGEVNLLAPLLAELERRHPALECVVSATTKAGYDLARKKYAPRSVFYCPLDFTWSVKAALARLRPDVLLLAELELWPNLIRAARRRGVRVAVVNGRLSERSFRGYRRLRPLWRRVLADVDLVAAQTEQYADRFRHLGAPAKRVRLTGSIKFDGARTDRDNADTRRLAALAGFGEDEIVWLAGSTQAPEEQIVLAAYARLRVEFPQLRLVLVPRHPERFEAVARLLEASGLPWRRRSALEPGGCDLESGGARFGPPCIHGGLSERGGLLPSTLDPPPSTPILLVDAVGELGAWWGTARVAFVGGSLGSRGGQNMIEPAAYGAAVCFGPNTRNFREVVAALLDRDAAAVVAGEADIEAFVRRCLTQPDYAAALGGRARALVAEQLGATRRTVDLIEPLLPASSSAAAAA